MMKKTFRFLQIAWVGSVLLFVTAACSASDGGQSTPREAAAPTLTLSFGEAAVRISETAPIGTVVSTASAAADDDIARAYSYSLVDAEGVPFAIGEATGVVVTTGALDYDAQSSYQLAVEAESGVFRSEEATLTITVVAEEVVLTLEIEEAVTTLVETAAVGTEVGKATASASDGGSYTYTYSLSITPEGAPFAIDAEGVITTTGALDYDTQASYQLVVIAEAGDLRRETTLGITVVAEEVVLTLEIEEAVTTLVETAAVGTEVGKATASASDGVPRDYAYTLEIPDGAPFSIFQGTGIIYTTGALDYDTQASYQLVVVAESGNLRGEATLSIAVTEEVVLTLEIEDAVTTRVETAAVGTEVGKATASANDDVDRTYSYRLSTIPDGDPFAIDVGSGVITTTGALDYDTQASYKLVVAAESGDLFKGVVLNIAVEEVVVTLSIPDAVTALVETAAVGTKVGTATASASDGGHYTYTYSLSTTPAGAPFAIDAVGVITTTGSLDYDAQSSYQLVVVAESGNLRGEATLGIAVEVVVVLSIEAAAASILENADIGTVVGTAVASASNGASSSYSLADAESIPFAIDPNDGEITLTEGLDYKLQNSYTLTVTASTAGGSSSAEFTIAVDKYEDGSVAYPYEIDTLEELQSLATGFDNDVIEPLSLDDTLASGTHYRLAADIDASPTADDGYNGGKGFEPIGHCGADKNCSPNKDKDDVRFEGTFNGAGFAIIGLHIDQETSSAGLFGHTGGDAVLRSLALDGGSITNAGISSTNPPYGYVGALVGYHEGLVQDSSASGNVSSGDVGGGLIGASWGGEVQNSFASGSVSGVRWVGGLIGYNNTGTPELGVQNSFASGDVSCSGADCYVGGLVGRNSPLLQNSYASGDVSCSGANCQVGGLVGNNDSEGTVQDSYASGDVSCSGADCYVGGLVGENEAGGTVQRSYCVDTDGTDCVGSGSGTASRVSLGDLRALTCDADTVFRWDDPADDPDDGDLDCAAAGESSFPWTFGSSSELPVLNGFIGGLDVRGQRDLIDP